MKIVAIVLAVVIVVLLGIVLFWKPVQGPTVSGNATSTAVVSADGTLQITAPAANATIASPVGVSGSATGGNWFFEASFPIKILDGDGTVLGQGPAQALGDWMTTGTVGFFANIPFTTARYATGTIVFANANPSGLPKNAKEFRLSVRFK